MLHGMVDPTSANPDHPRAEASHARLSVLDGWRAMSILLVLAAHMLPLGRRGSSLGLNDAAAVAGMSCFFTLSGFLIVTTIFRQPDVTTFLIRRLFRIVPAAYLSMLIYLIIQRSSGATYLPHLAFYINYDHPHITHATGVFWSLCVEIHFYLLTALVLGAIGLRGFVALPFLGLAITALKAYFGTPHNIMTHFRADEIMVGVTLGMIWMDQLGGAGRRLRELIVALPYYAWGAAFAVSSLQLSGPLQYVQPYFAGAMIGTSLLKPRAGQAWLSSRPMRYVAEVSYSLYIIHVGTMLGWLGTGGTAVKYLVKRPISLVLLFGLAHLSTFHFERHFIAIGKQLCRRILARRQAKAAVDVTPA